MWGQVSQSTSAALSVGIIPTRVGTSVIFSPFLNLTKDHPHACGDKYLDFYIEYISQGSSPRVWGQVIVFICLLLSSGIIPTRVGTSFVLYPESAPDKDHPHACGDKGQTAKKKETYQGSSPRVWGQV